MVAYRVMVWLHLYEAELENRSLKFVWHERQPSFRLHGTCLPRNGSQLITCSFQCGRKLRWHIALLLEHQRRKESHRLLRGELGQNTCTQSQTMRWDTVLRVLIFLPKCPIRRIVWVPEKMSSVATISSPLLISHATRPLICTVLSSAKYLPGCSYTSLVSVLREALELWPTKSPFFFSRWSRTISPRYVVIVYNRPSLHTHNRRYCLQGKCINLADINLLSWGNTCSNCRGHKQGEPTRARTRADAAQQCVGGTLASRRG